MIRSLQLFAVLALLATAALAQQEEAVLVFPGANSRPTWFTTHEISEAHSITRGTGAKIGILDHSFGFDEHRGLYAGGATFQTDRWAETFAKHSHHGWWMALVAREIAPAAEIYALGTSSRDDAVKVAAMVRAIDWAIEQKLDAITYSDRRISPALREPLDEAIARAVAAGVVVVFIHVPHPANLLPGALAPRSGDDEREPDVNVLHYDYTVVFADRYRALAEGRDARGYRPFLSMSSTAPVVAGVVALMRAVNPKLTPAEVREIMMTTARPVEFEGARVPRSLDAAAAVQKARALRK